MAREEASSPLIIEMPPELFAPAESSSFAGTFDIGTFEFGPDAYEALAPMSWNAIVTNVGGALLVEGLVEGAVRTSCSRCLDDVDLDIDGDIEGYFIIPGEGEAPEDMDDDEFDILDESHRIDFEPLLRAAIMVSLPLVPLCDEACKGLCYRCGANLNEGPCGCAPEADEEQAAEEAPGANNPFAVLAGYSFDDAEDA